MNGFLASAGGFWFEPVLVLTIGATLVVGLAGLVGRSFGSAFGQRTVWQIATLGLLSLLVLELSGLGAGAVAVWRTGGTQSPAPGRQLAATGGAGAPNSRHKPLSDRRAAADAMATVPGAVAVGTRTQDGQQRRCLRSATDGTRSAKSSTAGADARSVARDGSRTDRMVPRLPLPAVDDAAERGADRAAAVPATPPAGEAVGPVRRAAGSVTGLGRTGWPLAFWALGTALLVVRIVWAHALALSLGSRVVLPAAEPLDRKVQDLAGRLGVGRRVRVVHARGLQSPVACGIVRPTVALPPAFTEQFSAGQQEAILVHELAHLAARDPSWRLTADLVNAALWWHPAVWYTRRRLQAAAEAAADQASLLVPGGPRHLATSLVLLGQRLTAPARFGWLSAELSVRGNTFRSSLGRRAERLLALREQSWRAPRRGRLWTARAGATLVLVVVAMVCTAWVRPQAALAAGGSEMNVLRLSWSRSLAAAAALAVLGPADQGAPAADGPPRTEPGRPDDDGRLRVAMGPDAPDREEAERREAEEQAELERRERRERRDGRLRDPGRGHAERRDDSFRWDRLREKLGQIKHEISRAVEAGQHEAAERLAEQAHRLARELERRAGRPPRPDDPPRSTARRRGGRRPPPGAPPTLDLDPDAPERDRDDLERRLEHLRIAIDNLRAAGLHQPAEDLMREMERMQRERRGPRPATPPRRPDGHERGLEWMVQELHMQMQQMREQMRELHERLEIVTDRIEEGEEEKEEEIEIEDEEEDEEGDENED